MPSLIQQILRQAKTTFTTNPDDFNTNLNDLYNLIDGVKADDVNLDISFANVIDETNENKIAPVTYIEIFEDSIVSIGIFVLKSNKIPPLHNHPEMYGIIKVLSGKLSVESYSLNTPKTIKIDANQKTDKLDAETQVSSVQLYNRTDAQTQSNPKPQVNLIDAETQISYQNFTTLQTEMSSSLDRDPYAVSTATSMSDTSLLPKRIISAEYISKDLADSNSKPCLLKPYEKNLHEIKSIDGPAAFLDILAPPYNTIIPNIGPRLCSYYNIIEPIIENVYLLQETDEAPQFYWTDHYPYTGPDPTADLD